MARQFTVNARNLTVGTYGPYIIDGKQLGDVGCRVEITRGANGTWPLTEADPVLKVTFEGLYGANWVPLAGCTYTGGTQVDRFTGGTLTTNYANVTWPQERIDGVLTPQVPDSVRVTVELLVDLRLGASLRWL